MGTNFFAHIIPTKERKNKIKEAIDNDDFQTVKRLVEETYYSPTKYNVEGNNIHLGKRSSGWKFLWNPNWYQIRKGHSEVDSEGNYHWIDDGYTIHKYYDLNKKSITDFINQDNVVIYDEYDEKQNKQEFIDMAFGWNDGWDSDSYDEYEKQQNPSYISPVYRSEYTDFLENEGFKLSRSKTNFYSDGLRFATTTEFS